MPAKILKLPCYKVLGIQENEHDYHADVEATEPPKSCPHCQSSNLVDFGCREHRHPYYGVLAPNSRLRPAVTALAPEAVVSHRAVKTAAEDSPATLRQSPARYL